MPGAYQSLQETRGYSLDDRVQVVRTETNIGFAGACNLGAAQTPGQLLILLNNDTEPQAGWLDGGCRP